MKEYPDRESDHMPSAAEEWMPEQQTSDNTEVRTGFQPFYIVPLLYVISVYLIPVILAVMSKWENTPVTYLLCIPLIFGIANVINAIKFCKPENRIMLLNAAVLVKYALIPFFLVGGLFEAASIFFSLIPVPFAIFLFGSIGHPTCPCRTFC